MTNGVYRPTGGLTKNGVLADEPVLSSVVQLLPAGSNSAGAGDALSPGLIQCQAAAFCIPCLIARGCGRDGKTYRCACNGQCVFSLTGCGRNGGDAERVIVGIGGGKTALH